MKEFVYNIFLLSLYIKVLAFFERISFPVNFTVVIVPFLLFFIFFYLAKSKFKLPFEITGKPYTYFILFAFWAWILITLTYTSSPQYGYFKASLFVLDIIVFIYPLIVPLNLKRFLWQFIIIDSLLSPILFLLQPAMLFAGLEGSRSFYLLIGETSGIVILLLVIGGTYKFFRFNLAILFLVILHTFLLLMNTGRGPIIFTAFLLGVFFFFHFPKYLTFKTLTIVSITIILLSSAFYYFSSVFPEYTEFTLNRVSKLFSFFMGDSGIADVSASSRVTFLKFSFERIFSGSVFRILFGYGFGSFGILFDGLDRELYPHNIFVETWFETGLIGFLLISIFLVITFYQIIRHKNYLIFFPVMILFMDALKSFCITDLRIFFGFMGLGMIQYRWKKIAE